MKRSNRLVILVGVLLAVLAFVAIVILLNGPRGDTAGPAEPTTETVLVATQDIALGDPVTPSVVREVEIDPEAVQGEPLRSSTEVSGQPALFAIPEGSQVNKAAIGRGSDRDICIACQLNPGEKAIAFEVDAVTGTGLLVRAGDTVDLVISQDVPAVQETADSAANTDPEAEPRFEPVAGLENLRSVKAMLQDKRVLFVSESRAVPQEPTEDTNGDGVIDDNDQAAVSEATTTIIIIAGTTQDAEVVKFAQGQELAISTVIRNADDDGTEDTLGITLRQLVDQFGLIVPDVIQLDVESAEGQ